MKATINTTASNKPQYTRDMKPGQIAKTPDGRLILCINIGNFSTWRIFLTATDSMSVVQSYDLQEVEILPAGSTILLTTEA